MTFIDPPCALAATRRKSTGGAQKGGVVVPRDLKHQRHHFYLFVSRAQRVGLFCLPPPALSAARFPPFSPLPWNLPFPNARVFFFRIFSLSLSRSLSFCLSSFLSLSLGSRESQGLIDIQCRTAINSTRVQQQFRGTGKRLKRL